MKTTNTMRVLRYKISDLKRWSLIKSKTNDLKKWYDEKQELFQSGRLVDTRSLHEFIVNHGGSDFYKEHVLLSESKDVFISKLLKELECAYEEIDLNEEIIDKLERRSLVFEVKHSALNKVLQEALYNKIAKD